MMYPDRVPTEGNGDPGGTAPTAQATTAATGDLNAALNAVIDFNLTIQEIIIKIETLINSGVRHISTAVLEGLVDVRDTRAAAIVEINTAKASALTAIGNAKSSDADHRQGINLSNPKAPVRTRE
jgi:hypothetical protein